MAALEVKTHIKMKFVGMFKGTTKIVELPIPLISNSQKLEEVLTFSRPDIRKGPALCNVPMKWAGALLAVGGNWQLDEKITPDVQQQIDQAHDATVKEMEEFARENLMVGA